MPNRKKVVTIKHTQTRLPTLLFGLQLFFVSINATSGQVESLSRALPQAQAISSPDSNQESTQPHDETANISIAEFRQRLDALEQPVQQLAKQVRATEVKLGKDHPDSAKLRDELRALVQKTFAARQEIQRAELAEFNRRLQRMQQSIETRAKIAEKIVDRQMAVLLNPNTQHSPHNTNGDDRIVATTVGGAEISYIPWKAPKNARALEISPTAWGESVNGLRVALAVTDGPETKPGTQRLHLVIHNLSKESIQLNNTGWADDFTMALHVRRNSGEQVETRRPETDSRFDSFASSYSLEPGETVVLATKLIALADDSDSDNNANLLIADPRPQTNADGHRTWYLVGTSVNVPRTLGNGEKLRLHTGDTALEFRDTRVERPLVSPDASKNPEVSIQMMVTSSRNFRTKSGVTFAVDPNRVQLSIPGGTETEIQLTDIAGRHGLSLSIAFTPHTNDATVVEWLANNRVPVHISNDDFDQFGKGAAVTKVIYFPRGPSVSTSGFEEVLSWQLVPELDPVKVAEERGRVVVTVTMTPSQRPVVRIKDVSELKGEWRRIMREFTSNSPPPGQTPDKSALTMHITDTLWTRELPTAAEYTTTYDLTASPQQVTLHDAAQPMLTGEKRIFELSGELLFVASRTFDPTRASSAKSDGDEFTSFDAQGLVIDTYQRAGVIAAVDAHKKQVEISRGLNDDVKIGQRLGVAAGRQKVGTVEVINVERDNCVARILDVHPDRPIQKGDKIHILTDPTTRESVFPPAPKPEAKEMSDLAFESAAVTDPTSPPVSDAEKAIARMVLVFFQDEARRAVPGLMIDHGTEMLVLTTGPATIVPDGVGHAIDRAFLEIPGEADVASEFIDTQTADVRVHRAKQGLTKFQLNEPIDLAIGDSLSAIIVSGQPNLRVTPNTARISALDQATTFSLATHKFRHEFSGLVQIDTRLHEGTPLFKDGQLAGITLLGTRFMKDDVPGSYLVPASRIVEVLKSMKTE